MKVLCFIIFLINAFAVPLNVEQFHKPFWKEKPHAYDKIKNESAILISAFTGKIQENPMLYQIKVVGGGAVRAPMDDTFQIMTRYEDFKNVSKHFRDVRFDPEKKRLYLHMEAFDFHARMHLKLYEVIKENQKEIMWECVEGTFKGMIGVVVLENLDNNKTEVSLTADYKGESLPLPRVLMGLGLEVIGRQVAFQMREFIEKKYSGVK